MIKVTYICDNCKREIHDGATNPEMPTISFARWNKPDLHYCRACSELMQFKLNMEREGNNNEEPLFI